MLHNFFLKILPISFLLLCSWGSLAHPDGHYDKEDEIVLNTWQLKNGELIKGNFFMGGDDFIIVEQKGGKTQKIAVADLSLQNQHLANFKIKKFKQLNENFLHTTKTRVLQQKGWNFGYLFLIFILLLFSLFIFKRKVGFFNIAIYTNSKFSITVYSFLLMSVLLYACTKNSDNTATTTPATTIPKTRTLFIDSAFAPYKPAISTRWDDTYFFVASNGIPAHNLMVGITNWQQQVPIPQFYTGTNSWSIPLQPVYATTPLSTKTNFMKGAVAIASNGIPIFNALNNRGEDSYLIGELDNWGGHCGKGDDYHYHTAPLHLSTTSALKPIAFALDGFAVYGTTEPDGTAMQILDTCHGHIINNSVYHYHGTTNYPYVIGAMKGKVTTDPATVAPENQILPQAFPSPLRPATSPLNGASITAFTSSGTNAYKLTYKVGSNFGYIDYSWNLTNQYTFVSTNPAGVITTTIYQR